MPHYADGTPAKQGDLIKHIPAWDQASEVVGILHNIQPSDSCNGSIIPLATKQKGTDVWFPSLGNSSQWSVTLKECVRLDPKVFAATPAEPVTA